MKVPLLDLRRDGPELDAELEAAFRRVLRSGQYILGPEVEALERECAEFIGVRHAIGVSSGTDALLLSLMVLGIGSGDEVICPAFTFFASAGVICRVGAKPVFADIKPCCYNIDPADILAKITPRTKAIMPVHLFGQCADMNPILEASRARGIPIIEDAAQAIGAKCNHASAGSIGHLGCFSFFPSKNLGALGDSGMVTTNDDILARQARVIRTQGAKSKNYHQVVGGNFRIDALQAALIRVRLAHLDRWIKQRQLNAAHYGRLFEAVNTKGIVLPTACRGQHTYNQYVIRVTGPHMRDNLRGYLHNHGIATEVYYPLPMHLQPCFSALSYKPGDFPHAEKAAQEALALPIFPGLRAQEIEAVVQRIAQFVFAQPKSRARAGLQTPRSPESWGNI